MAALEDQLALRRVARDLGAYEREIRRQGFRIVAGVDEAGRGALAGPLVAAAVVLPEDYLLEGLRDSKLLSPRQRDEQAKRILAEALAISVCRAMPSRIDRVGLHRTNLALLREAVRRLPLEPEFLLTDGFPVRRLRIPSLSVKKGDAVMASVAAASVLAKVARDRSMDRYHRRFPNYGFDHNRGYGTAEHRAALRRFGPSPIHRRSFRNVPSGSASELGSRS